MKILLTNFHAGDGGGHTTYLTQLATGLAGRHEMYVAAPPGSRLHAETRKIPRVTVLAQPFPNGLDRIYERARARNILAARLDELGFDIIHVNGSADHRLSLAALRRSHRKRPAIVFTKHNSKPITGIGHAWRAKHGTDGVIAVCEHTRQQLLQSPYQKLPVRVIHNGVNTQYFSPWPIESASSARSLWADQHQLLLGSVAGTAEYKGWFDLARALALLPLHQRNLIRIVIAGAPPGQERLNELRALDVAECFHFPGLLQDVRGVAAAIDAGFVLSHDVETISFACREMMSMGKAVMVTDYAGLPENVSHGVDGWIVPVQGHTEIARTLSGMLGDPESLLRMGAAARARAVADFGVRKFVDETEATYIHLLEARARDAPRGTSRAHERAGTLRLR